MAQGSGSLELTGTTEVSFGVDLILPVENQVKPQGPIGPGITWSLPNLRSPAEIDYIAQLPR